jgi:hypothetical protein
MNTHTRRGLATAAGLLAAALASVVHVPAVQAAAPQWKSERGIVLECAGDAHGLQVWTSVYENQRYGNVVQVVIGDPDDGNGNSKATEEKFVVDGVVKATVKVDGKRALVEGVVRRHGARTEVHEEYEDAGFLIKTRGYHRQLLTDLGARYAGTSVPLACDTAFVYDLEVKKIPIV